MTRRAILDAARSLFTTQGYLNTPIRALAENAGVSVQTIYATFGSKPGVLMALLERMDQERVEPIAGRLLRAEDPGETLDLVASLERHVREAGGDVLRVAMQAAASDPEVARVWDEMFDRHRQGVARMCQRLARSRWLRPGLTTDHAIATAFALTSVEAYEELVHKQGWSHDRYEKWLAAALRHALLGED